MIVKAIIMILIYVIEHIWKISGGTDTKQVTTMFSPGGRITRTFTYLMIYFRTNLTF